MLARAGLEVDLGTRTQEQAERIEAERANERYLPGIALPKAIRAMRASGDGALPPRPRLLRGAVRRPARRRGRPRRLGRAAQRGARDVQGPRASARHAAGRVRVRARGLMGRRRRRRPGAPQGGARGGGIAGPRHPGRRVRPPGRRRARRRPLRRGDHDRPDRRRARRAAPRTPPHWRPRRPAAGSTRRAPRPARCSPRSRPTRATPAPSPRRSPAWPARATWWRPCSRPGSSNRRAGELLAHGIAGDEIAAALGESAEAVGTVPLLAARVRDAGVDAPVLRSLAGLIEGRVEPGRFTSSVTAPKTANQRALYAPPEEGTVVLDGGRTRLRIGARGQGAARRRVHRAVPGASARRLLLRVLPGGQPPRRRGPHGADLPAGLSPLRARAARVATAARCGRG